MRPARSRARNTKRADDERSFLDIAYRVLAEQIAEEPLIASGSFYFCSFAIQGYSLARIEP